MGQSLIQTVWGRSESDLLEEQQEGKCGGSTENKRSVIGDEARELGQGTFTRVRQLSALLRAHQMPGTGLGSQDLNHILKRTLKLHILMERRDQK